jgi:AspT/YidE/YbjL antiporter-like protein
LQLRDDLLVSGERDALIRATEALGSERVEAQETSEPLVSREFLIARKVATAHTLDDLAREGAEARRGTLQIESLQRGRHELPLLPATPLVRGDLVQAVGDPAELDRFAERVGIALSPTSVSSLLMLSGGVMLGYSLGFPRIVVAGVELSLGPGGGCLLAGLMLGWAHAKWRWLGAIPDVANDLLKDLGLSIFIASIGLAAGTRALDVLRQFGWTLPIASLLVTLLPALTSLFLGRHLLKLEPPILLGAIAGQQCSPPAIDTIVRAAGNTSPMLGYTVTYALSNVLLPLLGPLIVSLVAR